MKKEKIDYERDEDGFLRKVHTTYGEPQDRSTVIKEWNGLIGQEQQLLKDLAICRDRIEQLKTVREAIEDEIHAEFSEATASPAMEETDKIPEAVSSWAEKRKKQKDTPAVTEQVPTVVVPKKLSPHIIPAAPPDNPGVHA